MVDCIFCKIIEGKIPSTKIFENDSVVGFKDLRPQSKEHYLFIHRRHTANINEMADSDPNQLVELFKAISDFTKSDGLIKNGFRVVTNQGPHAGQTVFHTHFHVLGGEPLGHFGS
ncbi:MAG: histidine triad nucleotide-binding protein [Bacteriovoracaceae bacterium]